MFRLTRPTSPPLDSNNNSDNASNTCRRQALINSSLKLATHHPSVKLPPRLDEKPIKEQIQRCCDRFKSYPTTVDTLIRALSTILSSHPNNNKYRRIDQTNPGYQRSLARVPGAEQLLLALGFKQIRTDSSQKLFLSRVDRELLSLALDILGQTKETPEYRQAKNEQLFAKEVKAHLQVVTPTKAEQAKRQELLSRLPKEPSQGRSAVMMVHLDSSSPPLTRRFDGDDTFHDLLQWLGGTAGSIFLDKLCGSSREWSLVDVNRQGPAVPIDCVANKPKTLQYLGFWPSGRLELRPSSSFEWMERRTKPSETGASRGLGSAPSEALQ